MENMYHFLTRQHWLLLLIGALSVALSTNAQPPVIQWQRILEPVNPGGANGRTAIIKNSQGGYSSVTADQRLVSLTIAGDVISDTPITDINAIGATNRVLSAISPVLASDGAIVIGILSQTEGWKLQKRNVSGEIIWTSGVPFSQSSNFQYQVSSVVASLDGGYFVFATRYDNTYANPLTPIATYVKISHYSSTGYFLGDQDLRYSTITNNLIYYNGTRVNKVIKTPDGGFLAVGLANPTSSNSTLRGWAAKLNAQGTVVWQNRYESMNSIDDAAVSATGSYLLSGSAISTPSGLFSSSTLRVDASGSQGNNTPILVPYPAFNSLSSIASTPSGYIIGNDTSPNTNNGDIRLTSFSEQGAILWTKTIGGSGRDFNYTPDVLVTNDGYVVAGQTASTDGDVKGKQTNNVATWIVKLQNPNTILTLAQPTYNCQTGAFTFNTTGGDGSPITYSAPGITGSTTNPNQFVDAGLRQAGDAQPLTLSATQSGVTVTYRFDLRATCPIGTTPPVQTNQDRAILVDLYNSTNGPGWTNKTNWLQGDSPCNWFGVTCNSTGRVTKLTLVFNSMGGVLPASLGNLSQLTELDLSLNYIQGALPASLGNLSQLTRMNFSGNRLIGEIPTTLGNLSQLTVLDLAVNDLGGLGGLTGSIPASLGNLSQLTSLYLRSNNLSGSIPSELGNLSRLVYIDLGANKLSGSIPASFGNLSQLSALYLSGNLLSGSIPASLGNLSRLTSLYVRNNNLSGCFPAELTSLCGKDVSFSENSGLPGGGNFGSFCNNGTGACTTTPTTGTLALTAPTYNCTTGAITFNTSGGDGSPITYSAPGIARTSLTSNTGTVEQGLRNDPKPITIQATQSGQTVSYLFDLKAFCTGDDIRLYGVDTTFFAGSFDYKVGEGTYDPSNPIDRWSKTVTSSLPELYFNYRLQDDRKTYTLHIFGQKDNRAGSFPITITIVNPRYPNQPITNRFTLTFKKYGPEPGNLTLTAPTYNCTTGAIKFNTAEGNGTLIEYQAPGITGWTTNPNQFVDKDSRTANDVNPFVLMARQSGNVVTYTWDLKQTCGRARVATEEAGSTLSLQLLGNPVHETVQVLIKGAEGQPVQLRLTDVRGRLLESRAIEQAGAEEMQQFKLDPSAGPGMLFLQATKEQQTRTVKIIRQ